MLVVLTPMFDKDSIAMEMRTLLKKKRVVRYVSTLESWMLESNESYDPTRPVSAHPNRIEVIYILAEDKTNQLQGYYPILRPPIGQPGLAPFKRSDGGYSHGRFSNMFESEQVTGPH